ncbi:MAG: hypothetical protein ACI4V1_05100 [Eubacteriales bacterium]
MPFSLFCRTPSRKQKLRDAFGQVPNRSYFHGDMEYIRAYSDFRSNRDRDDFFIDDITWNDLGMDDVFKRVNSCLSTSGEQYLYYMLRCPSRTKNGYDERKAMIDYMGENASLRQKLQRILDRLGCTRRADLCTAFLPANHRPTMLFVYLFLFLLVPASLITVLFSEPVGMVSLLCVLVVNAIVHDQGVRRVRDDYDTVNYTVAMVLAASRIRKLHDPFLDAALTETYASLDRLRPVLRAGGVARVTGQDLGELVTALLLLDLLSYEFLKNKLGRNHRDIFAIHEALGRIDAAISAASYRASLPVAAEPELTFDPSVRPFFRAVRMTHPLLTDAIPNDLAAEGPVLITGSNASGKSTFLKTAALCALLAQSIGICTAASYRASAFRIATSMALSDNLLAGESYYIAETKSLKRIVDRAGKGEPLLCVIDEVLRGTNTVERIAASSEVLRYLAGEGTLCLAATHDIELCDLLSPPYTLYHFEEQVGDGEMCFDYKIRAGKATSRNAINLLKLLGFEESIVAGAHERANRYTETGIWK